MNSVSFNNPIASMLDKAFSKFDRNKDEKLDATEFQSLYEMLRTGIAVDQSDGHPLISDAAYFNRMDQNADGGVTRAEMQSTSMLIPAELSADGSLDAMIEFLRTQATAAALLAAQYLSAPDPTNDPGPSAEIKPSAKTDR